MLQPATPLHPQAETTPAALHALGGGYMIAVWESSGPQPASRVVPTVGGTEAPRPYTMLTVDTTWGGRRSVALLRRPAPGTGGAVRFHDDADGRTLAEAYAAGTLPDLDAGPLLGGLPASARLRVVRLVLDFCRSVQALKTDPAFVRICRRLILELSPQPSPLMAEATPAPDLLLCRGTLSATFGEVVACMVLTASAMGPAPFEPLAGGRPDRRGRVQLHLVIDDALAGAETLVVLIGRQGLACRTLAAPAPGLPTLIEHLSRAKGCPLPLRHYLSRCLAERGRKAPAAAAALRELQILVPMPRRHVADPARPVGAALDLAIPTGDGGLFLAGWLHDPHGLSDGLTVSTPFGEQRRLDRLPYRFPRDDVSALFKSPPGERSGFVAFLPGPREPAPAFQVHAELALASGGRIGLVPPPRPQSAAEARAAVLGAMPPAFVTREILEKVIAPAVAPLHAAHMATRSEPEEIVFGRRLDDPAVSIVIPLYRNLEFLRFQLSAFATDPSMAEAELIFVLDSPEQRGELEHFLHGLHLLYGLPMVLLVHGANYGYAAANNTGAAAARSPLILFLNSDVIPDRPGWLPQLVMALLERPQTGAVGPKLLFDDDSLQHAGLLFARDARGRWYNHHYYKGLPRDFAPATLARSVPGVTGACFLVDREVFEEVGGFSEDYVIGDYEDSDLCLKIRAAGHDIRYAPQVELYHLERQSISRHAGYTRGVASEYNGWLHAGRWNDLMEKLMSSEWPADGLTPGPDHAAPGHAELARGEPAYAETVEGRPE